MERSTRISRRHVLALGAAALSGTCTGAIATRSDAADGRLRARPGAGATAGGTNGAAATSPLSPGEHRLELSSGRDGLLYVPRELPPRAPLLLLLHGATGSGRGISSRIGAFADEFRTVILAPDSRGRTWDAIRGSFGPDVTFIDRALAQTFSRLAIDPTHVAVGGFSDGASYALSLGIINGDLFTHLIAFSPGFMVGDEVRGKPAIFVTHGVDDQILPIDRTSRRLVPALRDAGYLVTYNEFNGPHTVPADSVRAAFEWMQPRQAR